MPPQAPLDPARVRGLSRRDCLNLGAAALAAPLLQACGGGSTAPVALPPAERESVRWCRETIRDTLARPGIQTTAVSVALLAGDQVVWREAFGHVNREGGQLATPDTRFNIGSVAKVVSTLAMMILRDRGRLSLDQPVVELLPQFRMRSPGYTGITVRHLLSHSSGFPGTNERRTLNFVPVLDYAQDTLEALAHAHLKHAPGELAVYCNDGFTLIELIVHRLSGLAFPDFVQRELFGPLGMTRSGYATEAAPEGSFVHPYHEGQRLPQEMAAVFATGGVLTTPTDMLQLAQLLLNEGQYQGRRIVSAQGIRDMGEDQDPRVQINLTPGLRKGLGWDSVRQAGLHAAGLRCWEKAGNTEFFAAEFMLLPEQRLAVLITGCGQDYGYLSLAEGLLLRAAQEQAAITALPPTLAPVIPRAAPAHPSGAAWAGIYANDSLPWRVVAESDGSLSLSRWYQGAWVTVRAALRARSDGHWWADELPSRCYRFTTVSGHDYLVERRQSDTQTYWIDEPLGERLPPLDTPLPPAWQARLGSHWRCVNDTPDSVASRLHPWAGRIDELADMPGYLMWNQAQLLRIRSDDEAGMAIQVPLYSGRDLVELRMVAVEGGETLHIGSMEYHRTA